MAVKGFTLFETHSALNMHFAPNNKYDFFKYHGKTRLKQDTFKRHSFRWQYTNLESKLEHQLWFMWQMYQKFDFNYIPPKTLLYVGNKLLKQQSDDDCLITNHPHDFLQVTVKDDLEYLAEQEITPDRFFNTEDDVLPLIYKQYENCNIALETLLLIDLHVTDVLTTQNSVDIISWPQVVRKLTSLHPFIEQLFDKNDFLQLFSNHYLVYNK